MNYNIRRLLGLAACYSQDFPTYQQLFCYCREMRKRPLAVTIVAWLLIAVGILGAAFHTREIAAQGSFNFESIWVPAISLLAAVAGVFILYGHNWARWLALLWMAFHVAISFFDSWQKVVAHAVMFLLIAYILLYPAAGAYFRRPAAS